MKRRRRKSPALRRAKCTARDNARTMATPVNGRLCVVCPIVCIGTRGHEDKAGACRELDNRRERAPDRLRTRPPGDGAPTPRSLANYVQPVATRCEEHATSH